MQPILDLRNDNILENEVTEPVKHAAEHLLATSVTTFFAVGLSVVSGFFIADQIISIVVVHVFLFYIVFSVPSRYTVRVNPYITILDVLLTHVDRPYIAEFIGQILGSSAALWLIYIVIPSLSGSTPSDILSGVLLEFLVCVLIGWVFSGNSMPATLATTIGVTAGVVYPFIGLTTHSPFRWLAACIPSGACGVTGSWIYPVAPIAGMLFGYVLQKIN